MDNSQKTHRRALLSGLLGSLMAGTLPAAAAPRRAGEGAEAPSGPFLIQGVVKSVEGTVVTVKTADHGPGLTRGPGIRSRLVILGKSFAADISHAHYQAIDGTSASAPTIKAGDPVVMLVQPKAGENTTNVRAIAVTAALVIVNEQRPGGN
jgi:hypothetical protein